jgi:alkaline phosphatase
LERFKQERKSTGLVTTTYVTNATPAAFGAHEPSRDNLAEIATDYLTQTRPTVLFGGGGNGISPGLAADAGYTVVTTSAELESLDTEATSMVSGQFGVGPMPYEYNGLSDLPHLSEMTSKALQILDNDSDGFFLMVEGGRIDHAGHDNDIARGILEIIAFSKAVQTVLDWAQAHPSTLILVAGDHETGALTVEQNNGKDVLPTVTWSTPEHTEADVPVFAWGINGELVHGLMDNTDIFSVAVFGAYSLRDVISGLQTLSGSTLDMVPLWPDVNRDGRLGIEEVVYTIQKIAEF